MKKPLSQPSSIQLTFGEPVPDIPLKDRNPMIRLVGAGPPETKCKTCIHLCVVIFSKRYYKCELRGIDGTKQTDHRVGYNACRQYAEEEEKPALAEDTHVELGPYRNFCVAGTGAIRVNARPPSRSEPSDGAPPRPETEP